MRYTPETVYMVNGSLKKMAYNIAFFFSGLFTPFSKFAKTFSQSDIRQRSALTLSPLCGLGRIVQGQVASGIGTLLVSIIYVMAMVVLGAPAFAGTGVFTGDLRTLGILIMVIFTIIELYIYLRSISSTVTHSINVLNGADIPQGALISAVRNICKSIKLFFSNYTYCMHREKNSKRKVGLVLMWIIPGACQIIQGQIIKGIIMVALTALAVVYIAVSGAASLVGFFTLKTEGMLSSYNLVYGWVAILIILLFITFYVMSLKSSVLNAQRLINGERLDDFKRDLHNLIGKDFYKPLLFVPIMGALVFTILPICFMVSVAFTNWASQTGVVPVVNRTYLSWTGFLSFKMLFSHADYFSSFLNVFSWTILWAVLATFTCYFGGILLSLLINKKVVKCKAVWRSIFVLTMAIPQLVTLRVMYAMFNSYGPINSLLLEWGAISERFDFWGSATSAKTLIIFINMWVGIPYFMLLISGLLMNIPEDLYEYARIEGASPWYVFRKITMPYILFMTTPLLITNFISNFNNFNVIWLLTGGGPTGTGTGGVAGGTDIMITWLFKLTMQSNPRYNIGSAVGIIMFIISATLSLAVFHRSASYKREGDFQ